MFKMRRAVLLTGTSSNVTIDLAENSASTTAVGSREAAFFWAFFMCGGVNATYTRQFTKHTVLEWQQFSGSQKPSSQRWCAVQFRRST